MINVSKRIIKCFTFENFWTTILCAQPHKGKLLIGDVRLAQLFGKSFCRAVQTNEKSISICLIGSRIRILLSYYWIYIKFLNPFTKVFKGGCYSNCIFIWIKTFITVCILNFSRLNINPKSILSPINSKRNMK